MIPNLRYLHEFEYTEYNHFLWSITYLANPQIVEKKFGLLVQFNSKAIPAFEQYCKKNPGMFEIAKEWIRKMAKECYESFPENQANQLDFVSTDDTNPSYQMNVDGKNSRNFYSNTITVSLETDTPKFASAKTNRRSKAHRRTMVTPSFNILDPNQDNDYGIYSSNRNLAPSLDLEQDSHVDDILI